MHSEPPADELTPRELPFEGFDELIRQPLEKSDPKSFNVIKGLFIEGAPFRNNPFSFLIQRIAGKPFNEYKAREHWRNIMTHKKDMESKLGRVIRVQTAAVDYFTIISEMDYLTFASQTTRESEPARESKPREEWIERVYAPSFYVEKLKEELSRAKRYSHALSLIMFDVDEFHLVNEQHSYEFGDKILTFIIKVIKKTIRNVDIIARFSGDRFLIILPNTNKREAVELAERIRVNVFKRTERNPELKKGITATLSVTQCGADDSSTDVTGRMEAVLLAGKKQERNKVYAL
jgi:diguanylate cyclase (GGDEF)-like protein